MPRGISVGLRTLFGSDHFIPRVKVELESPDGIYVDMSSYLGEDYFDGVRLETDIDNATVTGTLWLRRDIASKSLSPLMGSSSANRNASNAYVAFLKAARFIRVSISAKAPGGAEPTEWVVVINDGKVDRVKFAKDPIELSFSDKSKWLTHKYIEDETVAYSSDTSPIAIETALQQVLTANPAPRIGAATFATPVSPAWNVGKFAPTGNVLEAIRAVALSIGWEWRERWSSLTANEFRLYSPNRAASVADWTFGPTEYFEIRELESNDDDIRNRVTVNYVGLDGKPASRTRNDTTSQDEYGIRFMGISKDKTASVRTAAQADALGDRALSDLAQPGAEHEIRTSLAPFVELGDMLAHLADNLAYDSTQLYAVVGITHEYRNGHGESTFKTRGKPAAAWRRWLEIGDDAEVPLPPNSTLDVYATQFDTTYSITWSGNGATTLSIDGGAYATPPSSPIIVTRNPPGGATKVYRFRTILGEDITYETIYVLPVGSDTVTPDIDVDPAVPATLTQSYTVTASNPQSGGAAPTIEVFAVGCSGTSTPPGGVPVQNIVDGASAIAVPSGSVVAMTRPAFGSGAGSVVFTALLTGGGRAEIQRTVTPRQSTGPNLTVTPTPFASTYSIAWSGDGVQLSIDGGAYAAPSASPIIVNRPAIGQSDKLYTFRGTLDGQTVTNSITIPAIGSPESPNLSVAQGTETDTTIAYTVTSAAPGGGTAPTIQVFLTDCTASVADGATITSGTVVTANRPAFANKRDGSIRFRATIGTSYEEITRTVSAQVQTSFGPTLTVTPSPFDTTYSLYFAGDSVQVDKRDGNGFVSPGVSPLIVTRPSIGSADLVYTFRATKDGQEVTNSITIPAVGNKESPNLNVTSLTPSATQQSFTVTASASTGTPTINVYFTGCSSPSYANGDPVTSGATVTVDKPAFGNQAGSVRFRATLGSQYEEISRTIVTQIKTQFGPSLQLRTYQNDATHYAIYWDDLGSGSTIEVNVNAAGWGAPGASPWVVTRPGVGAADDIYVFRAIKDGQTITDTITVPALPRYAPTLDVSVIDYYDHVRINANGNGATVTYYIDTGGPYNTFPLDVYRNDPGGATKHVTLRAQRDGIDVSNTVDVIPRATVKFKYLYIVGCSYGANAYYYNTLYWAFEGDNFGSGYFLDVDFFYLASSGVYTWFGSTTVSSPAASGNQFDIIGPVVPNLQGRKVFAKVSLVNSGSGQGVATADSPGIYVGAC